METTATSSGTRRPRSWQAHKTPMAWMSEATNSAVGRRPCSVAGRPWSLTRSRAGGAPPAAEEERRGGVPAGLALVRESHELVPGERTGAVLLRPPAGEPHRLG